MRRQLPRLLTATCSGLALWLLWAVESPATCNTIPVVANTYPSYQISPQGLLTYGGNVDRPIAEPGGWVTITLEEGCSGPTSPVFDVVATNNEVTLTFQSQGHPPVTTDVPVTAIQVENERKLRFNIPGTTSFVGPDGTQYPDGLAGPADITVKVGGVEVARISALSEPVRSGCDQSPASVFARFVVLPQPNDVGTQAEAVNTGGHAEIRMTLDGNGNLLIPLDHKKVLPAAVPQSLPVARFEYGAGLFDAFFPPSPLPPQTGTISDALRVLKQALGPGHQDKMAEVVRSFSIDGRPLPPLLRVDDQGALFGTADAEFSVLRIAESYTLTGGSRQLYNPAYLRKQYMPQPVGPIVITNLDTLFFFSKDNFELGTCSPVPLVGLRASESTVAYARDERRADEGDLNNDSDEDDLVVQVHDVTTGGQDCGVATGVAVADLTTSGVPRPILEVGGELAAFVGVDDALRVFTAIGTPKDDPTGANPKVQKAEHVNQRTLALSDPLVFFLGQPSGELRVFDAATPDLRANAQTPADVAAVEAQRAVLVSTGAVVKVYDGVTNTLSSLDVAGTKVAISDQLVALTVPEAKEGNVPRNNDGDTRDDVLAVHELPISGTPNVQNAGVAADAIGVAGSTVVFITPEAAEGASGVHCKAMTSGPPGCDLNGDGDADDDVIRIYRKDPSPPGGWTISEMEVSPGSGFGLPATDFVVVGDVVAFRSPEADQGFVGGSLGNGCFDTQPKGGCDWNGDGDANDQVMWVYDLGTGIPYNTGQAAYVDEKLLIANGLDWMRPYKVAEDLGLIFFLTREVDQQEDLDGDGSKNSTVLQIFNYKSLKAQVGTTVAPPTPPTPKNPQGAAPSAARFVSLEPTGYGTTFLRISGDRRMGPQLVVGSVVVGDQDGDGTFDVDDVCVHVPNPQQFDDDLDGLGNICDPTSCSAFVPPAPLAPSSAQASRCLQVAGSAGVQYLKARAAAVRSCLADLAAGLGRSQREPTAQCRGYFVRDVEVLPLTADTANDLRAAARTLTRAIVDGCKGEGALPVADGLDVHRFARRVRHGFGERVTAATRLACGNLDRPVATRSALQCQEELWAASTTYLEALIWAMQECLDRSMPPSVAGDAWEDVVARCLGRLEAGDIVPLTDREAGPRIERAERQLLSTLGRNCSASDLAALDTCGSRFLDVWQPLRCTNWRQAVEAIRSVYGPGVGEPLPLGGPEVARRPD